MSIYHSLAMPLIMLQPGLSSDSMHFPVIILTGSASGNGRISCWKALSNVGYFIQEAFCHLGSVSLESTVTDALEEYVL